MEENIKELIQKEFAHLSALYFNSAYFGPSPLRAKAKVLSALEKEVNPSFYPYEVWTGIPDRLRSKLAELIGCSTHNVSHSTSVTDIINAIANSYPFQKDDVVVCCHGDYPSNVLPWMRAQENGIVQLHVMPDSFPTIRFLEKNLPRNTRIFDISRVAFDSGHKVDLIELGSFLKERGIFFIVDATQSFGGESISRKELAFIDVFAVSSYKWMLGPYGHAFAYFSEHALTKLPNRSGNWINSPNSKVVYNLTHYTTDTLPGARKFDRGQSPNMLAMACLEGSLDLLNEIGLKKIEKYNHSLRDHFLENYPKKKFDILSPRESLSNIISLRGRDIDPIHLESELKHHNIDVSVREGKIRLSFHLFNTKNQVETLIEAFDI